MRCRLAAALAAVLLLTACSNDGEANGPTVTATPTPSATSSTTPTPSGKTEVVSTIARGLRAPWGIAFLPDGSALVTERDSRRLLQIEGTKVTEIGVIDAKPQGEAGLLGVAVSPDFDTNQRIFVYTTTADDNRVLSMTFRDGALHDITPILTGIPAGFIHDGGRLAFGPDGGLYVSTGEVGERDLAQDPDSLAGKILKITEDGKPFAGDSPVFTTGHRNVQGLAFDDTDRLWASEFGEQTWDELNLIKQGSNYGWPRVEGKGSMEEFTNPRAVWPVADASPSGLAFANGSLWMASLRGERLWQIPVTADGVGTPVDHFAGKYGRLRAVAVAPNGNLWLGTSNHDGRGEPADSDDRILEVALAE